MTGFKGILKRALSGCLAAIIAVSVTAGGINSVSAATYDPSAALTYAAAHWDDGKGECAEFVRDCLKAGGLTSLTSINTSGLMNQIINAGYGEKYRLVESSNGKYLMSDNSAILSPGDPIIFYCATCGFYPHIVLCGTGSGGYVTYYAHNNAANNKVLWANVGGSHSSHNNYAFAIHMKNNGYYPVDEYVYATYTVSNTEGSDLRNRPYKEYGYEDTSVSAVDFGDELVIVGFYENENGVTYARTESGYWIYATDIEKKEDLESLSISGESKPTSIEAGNSFGLKGTVTSKSSNISALTAGVYNPDGTVVTEKTVDPASTVASLSLVDAYIAFGKLSVGSYIYKVTAKNALSEATLVEQPFTVYASGNFTVTFDANGGECDTTSLEVASGEAVSALPTATREDYIFLGWYDKDGNEFTAETAVTGDITVAAEWKLAQPPLDELKWEIESYLYARYRGKRVTLHNVPYTLYHDYETEVAVLNGEVIVTGSTTNYYGEKWLVTDEGDWVKESDVTKIEDMMPFALSDDVNYPEKLHLSYTSCKLYGTVTSLSGDIKTVNGGIFDKSGNRVYGTTVTVDAATFNISKIDDYIAFRNLGAGEYYYRVIAENACGTYDVINYAFTVVDEYPAEVTITFKSDSLADGAGELTVARGDTVAELPTPTMSGYIFEGWVDEDGNKLTADTAVTYNMTVTPEWVRRVGDVNYDDATNAADLIILEQFMLGIGADVEIPDVNGDGIVDTVDAVIVQMAVLGIK